MAISQSTSLVSYTPPPSVPSGPQSPENFDDADVTLLAARDAPPQFKPRHLTVSDISLTHESAPYIRLRGKWLAQAGFNVGDSIRVTVEPQRLVIEPKAPEINSKSQIQAERRAALRETALHELAAAVAAHPAPASVQAVGDAPVQVPHRNIRCLSEIHGEWPDRIGAALEPALGDVLVAEGSRLNLHPEHTAALAGVSGYRYRAFARGEKQPNLSTFVAIAWVLDQDPRELFDKLLLQMGLPSGTRPIISPRRR